MEEKKMFLAEMKDNQKEAFMTLAYALISADGILDEKEDLMMMQYKLEMSLPFSYKESEGEVDNAVELFLQESDSLKKKIIFELVALAYTDGNYVEKERLLIEKLQTNWGIAVDFAKKCEPYILELTKLYEKIGKFVV